MKMMDTRRREWLCINLSFIGKSPNLSSRRGHIKILNISNKILDKIFVFMQAIPRLRCFQ